jgi:hypothetical protein
MRGRQIDADPIGVGVPGHIARRVTPATAVEDAPAQSDDAALEGSRQSAPVPRFDPRVAELAHVQIHDGAMLAKDRRRYADRLQQHAIISHRDGRSSG